MTAVCATCGQLVRVANVRISFHRHEGRVRPGSWVRVRGVVRGHAQPA